MRLVAFRKRLRINIQKGDYSDSYQYNKQQSEKNKWANMTSTYLNPYTMEGDKTIAYELFIQLGRKVPEFNLWNRH